MPSLKSEAWFGPWSRIRQSMACCTGQLRRRRVPPEIDMGQLERITSDPAIFGGKPIVRGMRVSVASILNLLAQGESQEDILADYPGLQPEDIRACLAYAHAVLVNERLDDVAVTHG